MQKKFAFIIILLILPLVTLAQTENMSDSLLYVMANRYESVRQNTKAYEILNQIYKRDTLNKKSLLNMARITSALGRSSENMKYLTEAYEQDTSNLEVSYLLLESYMRNEKHQQVLDLAQKIAQHDSMNYYLWGISAQSNQALRRDSIARVHYLKSIEFNPGNINTALRYLLFMIKLNLDDQMIREAMTVCNSTLNYNPNDRRILVVKGQLAFQINNYDLSAKIFDQLLQMQDSSFITLKYAGLTSKVMNNYERAESLLKKAQDIVEDDVSIPIALAEIYIKSVKWRDADENIATAYEIIMPGDGLLSTLLGLSGDSYVIRFKNEEAIKLYWQAYLKSDRENFNMLTKIYNLRRYSKQDSEDQREQSLFVVYTLINNHIIHNQAQRSFDHIRFTLMKCIEDSMMEGREQWNLRAPDGSRTVVTTQTLQQLLSKLDKIYAKQSSHKQSDLVVE